MCRDFKGGRGNGFAWRGDIGVAVSACLHAARSGGRLKEGGLSGGARRAVTQACGWGW